MKITFPHFGNTYIASKALFEGLGISCIVPPQSSKKSLQIGSEHSPDDICLPFKIMIGNYIQSIEMGADTIVIAGSCGPCRFGEYCELQMKIIKGLGYDVDFIVIDNPKDIGIKELMNRFSKIGSNATVDKRKIVKEIRNSINILGLMDKLDSRVHSISAYEKKKGECKNILNSCKSEVVKLKSSDDIIKHIKDSINKIENVEVHKYRDPIKIAVIGEIYTIIEPFSNMNIEEKLMEYGVFSNRKLTPSWWVKNTALSPIKMNSLDVNIASKEYLPLSIGGYARECIGEAILAKKKGYDGAIQIFPSGCMPEIVSKSILSSISKDKDFPIMTIIMDEITGEAGYVTRLEAFIDMLEMKREKYGQYQ